MATMFSWRSCEALRASRLKRSTMRGFGGVSTAPWLLPGRGELLWRRRCLWGVVGGVIQLAAEYEIHRAAHAQCRPQKVPRQRPLHVPQRERNEHRERDDLLQDFE